MRDRRFLVTVTVTVTDKREKLAPVTVTVTRKFFISHGHGNVVTVEFLRCALYLFPEAWDTYQSNSGDDYDDLTNIHDDIM